MPAKEVSKLRADHRKGRQIHEKLSRQFKEVRAKSDLLHPLWSKIYSSILDPSGSPLPCKDHTEEYWDSIADRIIEFCNKAKELGFAEKILGMPNGRAERNLAVAVLKIGLESKSNEIVNILSDPILPYFLFWFQQDFLYEEIVRDGEVIKSDGRYPPEPDEVPEERAEEVRANFNKLFLAAPPKDPNLVDICVRIDANNDPKKSMIEIAREFTGEKLGDSPKADRLLSRRRKLINEGKLRK